MSDHQIEPDLFANVLDVLGRHGFGRSDDEHTLRAIVLVSELSRLYEDAQDPASGPAASRVPSAPLPQAGPESGSGPSVSDDDRAAVTLTHADVRTVLTTLDLAADWKRDGAEHCAYCLDDEPCVTCERRHRDARSYDQLARQIRHDEPAARDARRQPGLTGPSSQPCPGGELEVGQ